MQGAAVCLSTTFISCSGSSGIKYVRWNVLTTDKDDTRDPLVKPEAFLVAEFSALRREIELVIKELGDYLRYAILASGAIWAWLLSRPQPRISHIGCFVPLALSLLIFFQTRVLRRKVFGLAKYIQKIEESCVLPPGLGWETQLASGRVSRDKVPQLENLIWAVLCTANLTGAVLVMRLL